MIYPGTQDAMDGGVAGDQKKRLIAMMAKRGTRALPLFGGQGRNANDLPSVGAPAIGFNPFLKMLAGRPGENFGSLNNPGIQNGPGPVQGGGAPGDPNNQGFMGSTSPGQNQAQAPLGTMSNVDPTQYTGGHYNEGPSQIPGNAPFQPQQAPQIAGGVQDTPGSFQSVGSSIQGLDPATQLFMLHLMGGLGGYNQDR
jgi:hypothetical protein